MRNLAALPFVLAASVAAAECPPAADISEPEALLLEKIQAAPNEMVAREISSDLWTLWTRAPDEVAQELLDRGMQARASWDLLGALDALNRLVEYCPHFAEGWNQRAFAHFLSSNYPSALDDLDVAIELSPNHTGALSGRALTLMGLGRNDEAQETLRRALALNPWLPERAYLIEPPGRDL